VKYESITKIIFGLFLLFFNIKYNNLDVYTSLLGILILCAAIWQLNEENDFMKKAFYHSIVQVVLQTTILLLMCSRFGSNLSKNMIIFTILGWLNMLVMFYNLFAGLGLMAKKQGHKVNAEEMHKCFSLYLFVSILILVTMILPLSMLVIPVAIIIFIYILVKVYRLNCIVDNNNDVFREKKFDKRNYVYLSGYIFVAILLCFTVLYFTNCKSVHTEIYSKNDILNSSDIQIIKVKMLTLGFSRDILSDLPDSEIVKYRNIRAYHQLIYHQQTDGGDVQLIACASNLDDGKIRYLDYYKWLKNPVHKLTDSFGLDFQGAKTVVPNNIEFSGAALYDLKTDEGVNTYKVDWIDKQVDYFKYPKVKYRIFGGSAINQRGFIAFNAQITSPTQNTNYNTQFVYCHQSSYLNIPYKDAFELMSTQNVTFNFNTEGAVFKRFSFITMEEYNP